MDLISTLKKLDTEIFLFLNSKHTPFLDTVMSLASGKLTWLPLYAFLLFLVFKFVGKRIWLVALSAAVVILLSDQLSVHLFKNVFLRYRPCHNLDINGIMHLNGNCGGMYGFVSSHAANTFALAMFLALFFKNRINYFWIYIFAWACFVSYSRIYNGVHYPADIAIGALLGMLIGWGVYKLYQCINRKLQAQ
jgi:undecaprenyl-diphosphatase